MRLAALLLLGTSLCAAQTQAPKKPTPPKAAPVVMTQHPKPQAEDKNPDGTPRFNTYEDFVEALTEWKALQVLGSLAHVPEVTINELSGADAATIAALNKRIDALENKLSFAEYQLGEKQEQQKIVSLDPAHLNVYQRIDSGPLQFLVSLDSITPYLNGYKAVVNVGNPSTARFKGVTINCQWSRDFNWSKYTDESYKAWQAAIHKSSTAIQADIAPGSWNPVEIILLPATAEELGLFTISIESNTVSLSAR